MTTTQHLDRPVGNKRTRASQAVQQLVDMIEDNIQNGVWAVGTQLPTERDLERSLGVSRSTIRRGLRDMMDSGRIVRQVGRGSFIAEAAVASQPRPDSNEFDLLQRIAGASPFEVMETRLILEPSIGALAAQRATAEDIGHMEHCLQLSEAAVSLRDFEMWDGSLHLAIMLASKNSLAADLLQAVNAVRAQPQWEALKARSVTADRRTIYKQQHRAIVAAISSRDSMGVAQAITAHLEMVRDHMFASRDI